MNLKKNQKDNDTENEIIKKPVLKLKDIPIENVHELNHSREINTPKIKPNDLKI